MHINELKPVRRPLIATRYAIARAVRVGDVVVDATVGNGHDTALLARLVGRTGLVVGFDVQEQAISATQHRLDVQGLADRVTLLHRGHENLSTLTGTGGPLAVPGVRCAVFNLGYLPGSDKSVITQADTTLTAVRAACNMLLQPGLVTIMVYPGHIGGRREADAVDGECRSLRACGFCVTRIAVAARDDNADRRDMPDRPYAYHITRPALP